MVKIKFKRLTNGNKYDNLNKQIPRKRLCISNINVNIVEY